MRVTSGDDLLALVAGCEEWRGRAVGALPLDLAPADAALWLRVVSLETAERIVAGEIIAKGKGFTPSNGLAALVAACCQVDIVDWTREEYVEADARNLFASADAVLEFGDPAQLGSIANGLLVCVLQAGGFELPEADAPASDAASLIDRVRGRGRWAPVAVGDSAAEVYVTRTTERMVAAAQAASDVTAVAGFTASNPASWTRSILGHVLLKGPGEGPLLTHAQLGKLPYGVARAIESVSAELSMAGGIEPRVRTFRNVKPAGDAGEGSPGQDLVDHQDATPSAV